MKNKKPAHCCFCGKYIPVGEGFLFYVDEEDANLGFGPLGEYGWLVKCVNQKECSARVEEQKKAIKEKEEKERKIRNIESVLFPLTKEYHAGWEKDEKRLPYPEGEEFERKGYGWDIYGFGTRYVVQNDKIWRLENNGSDGAMWDLNNIVTGGAGAIGYIYPITTERIDFLIENFENISEKKRKEKKEKEERERIREEEIRIGLLKMKERCGGAIDWKKLEESMKKAKTNTFCPKELTINGKPKYNLTINEAKRILGE